MYDGKHDEVAGLLKEILSELKHLNSQMDRFRAEQSNDNFSRRVYGQYHDDRMDPLDDAHYY